MKRVGFFKNAYRNVRKAYVDRRTTQSEFCFEINILCDRRSVQWRAMKFEVGKTVLQTKVMLKLVNKQPSGFRFHQVLRCFRVVWSHFWTTSKFLSAPETTTNNHEVKTSLYKLQNVRKTALQNKLTLNSYSSNGKQTAKRTSDFIKFYAVLELFEANSGHLQNVYRL